MFHCISSNNSHLMSAPHPSGVAGGGSSPGGGIPGGTVPHYISGGSSQGGSSSVTLSPSLMNPFSAWYSSNSLGSYYNAIGFSRSDMKHVFPDLRIQLIDQLKTLDTRLETQVQLTSEIQEFFKKRAEVELETSRALEKLAKNLNTRHKEIKAKRDSSSSALVSSGPLSTPLLSSSASQSLSQPVVPPQPWSLFNSQSSLSICWQQLINDTKVQSQNHAILADIYSTEITQRLQFVSEDLQRIYKQCREIGLEAHEELLKVLHELHTSMKTYHTYQTETRIAEAKLKLVEAQKAKLETQIPKEKLEKSKKMKLVEKEVQKRTHKFTDARFKSQKAKNEYTLCMDAANAAVQKYFMEDLSDLIDCMDLGFYECVTRSLNMYVSSQDQIRKSLQQNMDNMSKCISSLDARLDKQKFLESHNTVFALPKKFEFVGPTYPNNKNTASIAEQDFTPDPPEIETSGFIRQELEQRLYQLHKRLDTLRMESDELWKTLETAENSLLEMITAKDYDTVAFFIERSNRVVNEAAVAKMRSDKQETDEFHLNKFRDYMLTMNRISRLQSKYEHIRSTLKTSDPSLVGPSTSAASNSAALAASTRQFQRRKRIGQIQKFTNTRLFGGSIEEYLEKANQDIPLVMTSCIRVINLFGLHHQGIFRVSGSQVEINNFKESFEKGEDPLADMTDASDINSIAGVLKLYLRELREPLFPICYFEQFMELAQLDSNNVFITRMRDLVKSLPRAVFIVLRYLFAFLNHLSEYSDENMMDPYNLAICFGPTLVPVPEDKDQVQYQNLVNELIKNVILYHDEIFVDVPDGVFYEKYISSEDTVDDDNPPHHHQSSLGAHHRTLLSESSPVLKKSLSCGGGGGGKMTHSRDDSNCSSLGSCGKTEYSGGVMSEEANKRHHLRTSPLPNPPLSPVIKETVILNDEDEEDDEEVDGDASISVFQKKSDYLEAIAQFDFSARSTRELSLKKGETLVLYAQVSSDWWKGANRRGDEGLIPDKYILLKIRDEDLPCQTPTPSSSSSGSTMTTTVPPPLTTPPSSLQKNTPLSEASNKSSAPSRNRTSSDSLLTTPIVNKGQQDQQALATQASQQQQQQQHTRSFSVSDDRKGASSGGELQNGSSNKVATLNGVHHDAKDKPSAKDDDHDPTAHEEETVLEPPQASSQQRLPPIEKQPPPGEGGQPPTTASPLVVVKSNIQFWEQRLSKSSSATATAQSGSSSPLLTSNTAPDLVMDLPQSNAPVSGQQQGVSPQPIPTQSVAPVPPKFTDTSPSSSDESDSSESSNNSNSSSPSTPTRTGSSSGAEVFAKQKNATLKKRALPEAQVVGTASTTTMINPNPTVVQQQSSWSNAEQRGGMFTFSSNFNKPQVKVKPVVLSKPKLPREFVLNKMEEDDGEEAAEDDKNWGKQVRGNNGNEQDNERQ